jgi:hypothetical protein
LTVGAGDSFLLLAGHHQTPLVLLFEKHKLHLIILKSMGTVLVARVLHSGPDLAQRAIPIVLIAHGHESLTVRHGHQIILVRHNTGSHQAIRHALVIHS